MAAPLYDVFLLCHLASALIGLGAVAVAGYAASRGKQSASPRDDEWLLRFFREGTDWPSRLVLLVPVFGLTMLFGADHQDLAAAWPWVGLGLWLVAAGHLVFLGWPAETRAQRALAGLVGGAEPDGTFARACGQMERAAGIASVCFVLAVAVMIWQP
jgi:hypothetical protein